MRFLKNLNLNVSKNDLGFSGINNLMETVSKFKYLAAF